MWFSFCCISPYPFLPFPVYILNANAIFIFSNIQLMFNSRKVLISKMGQSLKMMCTAHLFELSSLHCAAGFIVNPEEHEDWCLKWKVLQYVSRYFLYVFILYVQNKSISMKYSPGCIFTAVVISRWVMHNAERGQFILLLQILQISLKNQPLCKIFANYHQESTTLHKFWKLQWKTNHIAQLWVITMKDPLYCTILANYDEKSTRMHKPVSGSQRLRGRT